MPSHVKAAISSRVILLSLLCWTSDCLCYDVQCAGEDFRRYCPVSGEETLFSIPTTHSDRVRGITIAPIEDRRLGQVGYGSARIEETGVELSYLGANWISLTPFGRMDNLESVDILPDFEIPIEQNEALLRKTVQMARRQGMKVAIVPHIYVMSGEWRGEIALANENDFEQWFANYENFVLRFAELAEETGAEMLSIGVEFKSTTNARGTRWRQLIHRVRSHYSGSLTYSANWDEVDDVEFWDLLDIIGINAFWPLARRPGDGYEEMMDRSEAIAAYLEGLALYWNRPIVFTEFGIKTATDSALAPGEWPENCRDLHYDEADQAAASRAVLSTMASQPWFEGLFIWKYFSDPFDETQELNTGFSPRAKMAESVLFEWFQKPWNGTPSYQFF